MPSSGRRRAWLANTALARSGWCALVLDAGGRVVEMTPSAMGVFGIDRTDLDGAALAELAPALAEKRRGPHRIDLRVDGHGVRSLELHRAGPDPDDAARLVVLARDVTEVVAAELQSLYDAATSRS